MIFVAANVCAAHSDIPNWIQARTYMDLRSCHFQSVIFCYLVLVISYSVLLFAFTATPVRAGCDAPWQASRCWSSQKKLVFWGSLSRRHAIILPVSVRGSTDGLHKRQYKVNNVFVFLTVNHAKLEQYKFSARNEWHDPGRVKLMYLFHGGWLTNSIPTFLLLLL